MNRETESINNLFFTCSLIEKIVRDTKNTKKSIVGIIGEKNIRKIYDLADWLSSKRIIFKCTKIPL